MIKEEEVDGDQMIDTSEMIRMKMVIEEMMVEDLEMKRRVGRMTEGLMIQIKE